MFLKPLLHLQRLHRTTRPLNPRHNLHRDFYPLIAHECDRLAGLKIPRRCLALQALRFHLKQPQCDSPSLLCTRERKASIEPNDINRLNLTAVLEEAVLKNVYETRPGRLSSPASSST